MRGLATVHTSIRRHQGFGVGTRGRTAVVVLPRGATCPPDVDPRVQVLSRPLSVSALLSSLMAGAQSASAFRDLSALTRLAATVR